MLAEKDHTIENNYVGKDKSIFVDPDNHDFRVKKSAKAELGLSDEILDEDFDLDLIGIQTEIRDIDQSFQKTYPKNGETGFSADNTMLAWQSAMFADWYEWTIAEDPEMQNVVKTGIIRGTSVNIDGLEKNKSYYWTVKAVNKSKEIGKTWEADGVPYMFTTASTDYLIKGGLEAQINRAKSYLEEINEGSEIGQNKPGTRKTLEAAIAEGELIVKMVEGEQSTLDNAEEKLRNAILLAQSSVNVGYMGTLNTTDASKWVNESKTYTACHATQDGDAIKIQKTLEGLGTYLGIIGTKDDLNGAGVYTFDVKASAEKGWFAFGMRHSNLNGPWIYYIPGGFNSVYFLVKKDGFELQKANDGQTGIIAKAVNNGIWKDDDYNRVEMGLIPAGDGMLYTIKVNDVQVFNYYDTVEPIRTQGRFVVNSFDGEVDILESFTPGTFIPHFNHWGGYGDGHKFENTAGFDRWATEEDNIPISLDEYHTFAVNWDETGYTFYVDGKQSGKKLSKAVSHTEQFILLFTEAQGYRVAPGYAGEAQYESGLKDSFVVDYVRVFDKK